ncbi:MAG: hypothetical protein NTW86_02295 [Candidatus Sumerlaeota bacterium]|nr:hypothetical protein [Candidatus Sumerlaeota bacterium]
MDLNKLAKKIVDEATGNKSDQDRPEKNPAAVALGRLGGLKGGKARAEKLSPDRRKAISQKAARERWKTKKKVDTCPKYR